MGKRQPEDPEIQPDQVWFTQWPSHAENIFSVSYSEGSADYDQFVRDWQAGLPLNPDNIPGWLVLRKGRPAPKCDLFAIQAGIMVISERLADIFRQFNLGPEPTPEEPRPRRTELHPMPLFSHDERTLIRKVVLLQCSAQRDGFVPEETKRADFMGRSWMVSFAGPHEIAIHRSASSGFDFWRDPNLAHTWFCSNPLYQAMKDAGIAPLAFHPCRMVG